MVDVDQGAAGGEQPGQDVSKLLLPTCRRKIPVNILDRGLQHVQPIPQIVERVSRQDQLGLTDPELEPALASDVVGLAAGGLAELTWPTGSRPDVESPTAPPASSSRR
ncbi:MAG: hypothetical protein ACT4OV_13680 [Microthrixaceae bacterium]